MLGPYSYCIHPKLGFLSYHAFHQMKKLKKILSFLKRFNSIQIVFYRFLTRLSFVYHFSLLRSIPILRSLAISLKQCLRLAFAKAEHLFYLFLFNSSIKFTSFPNNTSVGLIRPDSGPFSSFNTPLGHTALQIPHPTQLDLTMFSPF